MKKFVLYVIAAILSCMPAVAGNDVKIVNSSDAYIPLCSKKATKNLTKLMKGYLSRLENVPVEVRMYHIYTVTDNSMLTFAALDSISLMYKDKLAEGFPQYDFEQPQPYLAPDKFWVDEEWKMPLSVDDFSNPKKWKKVPASTTVVLDKDYRPIGGAMFCQKGMFSIDDDSISAADASSIRHCANVVKMGETVGVKWYVSFPSLVVPNPLGVTADGDVLVFIGNGEEVFFMPLDEFLTLEKERRGGDKQLTPIVLKTFEKYIKNLLRR